MNSANSRNDDPVYVFLRHLFHASSHSVLAASAVTALGCEQPYGETVPSTANVDHAVLVPSTTESGVPAQASSVPASQSIAAVLGNPEEPLTPLAAEPTCEATRWRALGAIAPTVRPNYLAWRYGAAVHDERGVRCEGSADARVCEAKIRELDAHGGVVGSNVLSTTGDLIEVWQGEQLLQLLGRINTADEALMAATQQGYAVECFGPPIDGDPNATQLNVLARDDGFEVWLNPALPSICGNITKVRLHVNVAGQVDLLHQEYLSTPCPAPTAVPGRRPPGLRAPTNVTSRHSHIGTILARDAHGEAASVPAFEILAKELALHGAPKSLQRRAQSAAEDEVRHAESVTRLAERFGARVQAPVLAGLRTRTLAEITLDNALVGCVGETFAALLATFQATQSRDPTIRATLAGIAADETEHAAFSYRLHQWAQRRLGASSRERIRDAQRAELRRLRQSATEPHPDAKGTLGLPSAHQQRQLLDHLEGALLGGPCAPHHSVMKGANTYSAWKSGSLPRHGRHMA